MGSGRKALQIGTHYHPFLRVCKKMVSVSLVTTLLLQLLPPILSARPSFCSVLKSRFKSLCSSPPPCCGGGHYTTDKRCCLVCAGVEGDQCGGQAGVQCGKGLQCLKSCGSQCDRRLDEKAGVCINLLTPGSVPNWPGAPKTHLAKPTYDLVPAPTCQEEEEVSSCSCDRGHTAIRLDDKGRPRGNCTGVPFDSFNDNQKPWCFLKNIPKPSTKCFKDAQWSRKDGRFWSYKACSANESGDSRIEIQLHEFDLTSDDLYSNNLNAEENESENEPTEIIMDKQETNAKNMSEKTDDNERYLFEENQVTDDEGASWFSWLPSVF